MSRVRQVAKPVTLGGVVWAVTTRGTKKYPHWCVVSRVWEHNGQRSWGEEGVVYFDARYLHPRLRAAMGKELPRIPQSRRRDADHREGE